MSSDGPKTIPILPSPDFDATAEFYSLLGFVECGRWPREYLILRRADGVELHFWSKPAVDPATNDAGCYVRYETSAAVRSVYDEWARAALPQGARLGAPKATGYGLLEIAVVDPHGNLMRVGGRLA